MQLRLLIAGIILIIFSSFSRAVTPVSLAVEDPTTDPHVGGCGLLLREFVRQGILISARDEMGLPTRDGALRESIAAAAITPHTLCMDKLHINLDLPGSANAWHGDLDVKIDKDHDVLEFLPVLTECEKLSRGVWLDLVKKTATTAAAPKWNDSAAPENADELLANFNIVSQFAAVRLAHGAIAESGSSSARLDILIRGYAHLGRLTEFHWSVSSKVFKARSLLYAQRLVAHNPESAGALYDRAYALAWAGIHGAALEDLDRADTICAKSGESAPPWAEEIRAFCRDDVGALTDLIAKNKSLASLLSFFAVECCSRNLNLTFARAALSANPECLRIIDGINSTAEVAEQHRSTLTAFPIFPYTLAAHLPEVPGLPAATKTALTAHHQTLIAPHDDRTEQRDNPLAAIVATLQTLSTPQDSAEPSLNVLKSLLDDSAFVMVEKRGEFIRHMLGLDATEFLESVHALVESHPLVAIIDSYDNVRGPGGLQHITYDFASPAVYVFCSVMDTANDSPGMRAMHAMYRHTDNIAFDQEYVIQRNHNDAFLDYCKTHARQLLAVCPFNAAARAIMVEAAWDEIKDRAPDWESSDHPALLLAFGKHYLNANDYKKAETFLSKCVEKATDSDTYTLLANAALGQHDEAKYLAVMNQYLSRAEDGLESAQARLQIARHLTALGDYAAARQYAEAAAKTGAGWAYIGAAECAEKAGDFTAGEQYLIENANHYNDPFPWYFWCRRTGHGDIQSARSAVELTSGATSHQSMQNLFVFYMLEGSTSSAKYVLKKIAPDGDPIENLHLALLADAGNNPEMRDACLARAADEPHFWRSHQPRPEISSAANLFRRALAKQLLKLDLSIFDDLMINLNDARRSQLSYFIGRFLEIHHLPQADEYLQRAASTPSLSLYTRLLATQDLKSRGIAPATTRPIESK